MASHAMPAMVVSSNRFLDIEPYCNRLRAADPIAWGSIFPWEFPQNASREQEEDFLREWFSAEQIHVQGGAGKGDKPGDGYRFLKQVWYSQAIWNWEKRVPAFCDWWLKSAESDGLVHDANMQQYILDPKAGLKAFFNSSDLDVYGEKFLLQVIPVIQQAARARMETSCAAGKNVSTSVPTRATARASTDNSTPATPTAALETQSDMPGSTGVSSQPLVSKSKKTSSIASGQSARHSAVSEASRPRMISEEHQEPVEQPTAHVKRGHGGGRRCSNRASSSAKHSSYMSQPELRPSAQDYPAGLATPIAADGRFSQFAPGGPPSNGMPRGRGHGGPPQGPVDFPYRFPTLDSNMPPSSFAISHDIQPNVVWVPHPMYARGNGLDRQDSMEIARQGASDFHGGREYFGQEHRGGKGRGFSGDHGRGRSFRGPRDSFGSQGQAAGPKFSRNTSYEFGGSSAAQKARRGSVVSVEKNSWRSGSEHPQDHADAFPHANFASPRSISSYVPARNPIPFDAQPPYPPGMLAQTPHRHHSLAVEQVAKIAHSLPDNMRYHCTQTSIGDLCPYATKLAIFNIPFEANDNMVSSFFEQFGHIVNIWRRTPVASKFGYNQPPSQMAIINFATADHARSCLRNKPDMWLHDNRPLRVEVAKEYWDASHERHFSRNTASGMPPVVTPGIFQRDTDIARTMHHSHDSVSTIRGPLAFTPEQQSGSGQTTPVPSGTNTPKKKSKSGKNKKCEKDSRTVSLAGSFMKIDEQRKEVEGAPGGALDPPASSKTTGSFSNGVELTMDVGQARSAFESTEIQTTSEPSITPVDKVTTKLPLPRNAEVQQDPITSAAISNVAVKDTSVQTTDQTPLTPANSSPGNPSTEADTHKPPFREHEAKAETPAAGMKRATEIPNTLITLATVTDAKTEEEHVDDSFHTASGSPSITKGEEEKAAVSNTLLRKEAKAASTDPTSTKASKQPTDDNIQNASALSAQEEVLLADGSDSKAAGEMPSLAPDTGSLAAAQQQQDAKRAISGDSALAPPATYVTAPNTPVVEQEADKVATIGDDSARSKKAEKSKGPSKTESLSMFGKKQERKQPKQKKGTLKGKPKELPTDTDPSVPSPASISTVLPSDSSSKQEAVKHSEGNNPKGKRAAKREADITAPIGTTPTDSATPSDPSDALASTGDSNKPKDNLFTRWFAGSKAKSNSQTQTSSATKNTQDSLTREKDSKNDPVVKSMEATSDKTGVTGRATDECCASDCSGTTGHAPTGNDKIGLDVVPLAGSFDQDDSDQNVTTTPGLGISDLDATSAQTEAKSKKRRKGKKKSKESTSDLDEGIPTDTPAATPEPEEDPTTSGTRSPFRSRDGRDSTRNPYRSNVSDTSSITVGQTTPSTAASSPKANKPRKLPMITQSAANIVHEKEPAWKNRRRAVRAISGLEEPGDEESNKNDDNQDNYALETVDSTTSNTNTNKTGTTDETYSLSIVDQTAGMQTPRTVLLLPTNTTTVILLRPNSSNERVGADHRVENIHVSKSTGDGLESEAVRDSKAKMRMLLEQETRHKYEGQVVAAGGEGGSENEGGQNSRIEELSKLLLQLIPKFWVMTFADKLED